MELLNLFCLLKIVRNALIALKLRGKPDIPLFAENAVCLIRLPPPPPLLFLNFNTLAFLFEVFWLVTGWSVHEAV